MLVCHCTSAVDIERRQQEIADSSENMRSPFASKGCNWVLELLLWISPKGHGNSVRLLGSVCGGIQAEALVVLTCQPNTA